MRRGKGGHCEDVSHETTSVSCDSLAGVDWGMRFLAEIFPFSWKVKEYSCRLGFEKKEECG